MGARRYSRRRCSNGYRRSDGFRGPVARCPGGATVTGAVFYSGPSMIDGRPIIAVATFSSGNRKTGDMVQTWILRRDLDPMAALQTGKDASICGGCYHRGTADRPRTCYVNVGQAPLSVWRAWRRGVYARTSFASIVRQHAKPVRMGAYGDPVAVPWHAWDGIHEAPLWTGYTHQWRSIIATPFRNVLMASCDSTADMVEAAAAGWRTFRIGDEQRQGEIACPSSRGTQCADCGLCAGLQRPSAPSIYIPAHGSAARFVGTP